VIKYEVEYYEAVDVKPDGFGMSNIEVPLGKFTRESDAKTVAKGRGAYGKDGKVEKGSMSIVIYDNLTEYEADVSAKLKEQALRKLTAEERAVLGL